jgi:inorganic pyrophosphatase
MGIALDRQFFVAQMDSDSLILARAFLGRQVTVHIDRPLGSRHPRWGFGYPVNYGYVPGVTAPDGEDLDAYVLGVQVPLSDGCNLSAYTGRCIAIIHRLDDDDDKLVVVPDGTRLSDDDILAQTHFQERFFDSCVLRA